MTLWERKLEDVDPQPVGVLKEEARLNKSLYKVFLALIKYAPIIDLISEIGYSLFAYFKLDGSAFMFLGGFSIIGIVLLYLASYVFKFCYLYRVALHTIVLVNIMAIIDTIVGIPLSDLNMLRIYLITLLIGVIAYIRFNMKHNKRTRPSN